MTGGLPASPSEIRRALGLDGRRSDHVLERACEACLDLLSVDGAGISLMSGPHTLAASAASDARTRGLVDLQFVVGVGPILDAHRRGEPVLVADLAATDRWPEFSPIAAQRHVGAVFAFPLNVGAARFGALSLYREAAVGLSVYELADALTVAGVVTEFTVEHEAVARAGESDGADLGDKERTVVHQATGMIAAQLGCPVEDALIRLRAYAYTNNLTTEEVAARVVARALRFDADSGDGSER